MANGSIAFNVVLEGGNSKKIKLELPPRMRLGDNRNAYRGACRLWHCEANKDSHLYLGEDLSGDEEEPKKDAITATEPPPA